MRLLAQFVAVLLLVGFMGAYFWWIVAPAAVAGLAWLAVRAYPVARAEFEADARRRAQQARKASASTARRSSLGCNLAAGYAQVRGHE